MTGHDEITCPYCNESITDLWEYFDEDEIIKIECPNCDKIVEIERSTSVDYSIYKTDDNEKE